MTVTIKRKPVGTIAEFEKQFEKKDSGVSGPLYPTRVGGGKPPRNKISVRFLAEPSPTTWVSYEQYFDTQLNLPVIATEENEESYKARNLKPSTLHLAPAVDIETNQIIALELKWSLVQRVNEQRTKYESKFGPLTDWDIELIKKGTGLDTEYQAYYDGGDKLDLSRYEIPGGHKTWADWLWTFVERQLARQLGEEEVDAIEDDTEVEEEEPAKSGPVLRKKVVKK